MLAGGRLLLALGRTAATQRSTSVGVVQRRFLYDPLYESEADLARKRRHAGRALAEATSDEMRQAILRMADERVAEEQAFEEHHGSDLFAAFESLVGQSELDEAAAATTTTTAAGERDEMDLDVILEGLPRLSDMKAAAQGAERVSIPQISALSYAIGFVGHWQRKLSAEVMNLDEWQCEERWLPGYYREALGGCFFLDLDKSLLGKSTPDPWMSELLESWLCGRLGWKRLLDPSKVGKGNEPTSFGFLCLPFAAFAELTGDEIGTPVDETCTEPSPKVLARRLSHRYITSERVHRAVVFSPKSDLDSPNTPATAWVREPAWQNSVVSTFFGEHLGYQVRFNPGNEEVLIRAPPDKMIEAVDRVVDALAVSAAAASSLAAFPALPMNPPFDVQLSRDAILSSDLLKARDISKACHLDLWILSRVFHWMNHVRSYAKNIRGATPLRLADNSTVFAVDIGRIEESWQQRLAQRWLGDMLGWSLLVNDPSDTSYAYFSHQLLTSNYEYFVTYPPTTLSFAQLTPGHMAWITVQRELAVEIRALSNFIESNSWTKLSDYCYSFQRPVSKWMRPVVAAFFEKFLGYRIVWASARRVSLLPNSRAMQEAVSVLIGRKELREAYNTMAEHASVNVDADDDDELTDTDDDVSTTFHN